MWRGWTSGSKTPTPTSAFLLEELFPSMRGIPGFRGADVAPPADGDEVAFVTLTRFDSLDAVRAFARRDFEVPVLEPQALSSSRHDERAVHYDDRVAPGLHPAAARAKK